jgi:hypothetical protein
MVKKTVLLLVSALLPVWAEDVIPPPTDTKADEPAPVQAQQKCGDWERFTLGEIVLENNVWNKKSVTDYRQCLFQEKRDGKTLFGWEWKWPDTNDVLAYPEIIYGWKPWNQQSTTPELPRRVKAIQACAITYDIDMQKEGVGNLTFDIWLTREATPAEKNISMELMIWLEHSGQIPDGSSQGTVKIDGASYDFYKGKPPHAGWGSTAFLRKQPARRGVIDLKKFLDFLVKNKHLSGDDYLASIEFGNEICGGKGRTEFKDYRIVMKSK